MENNTLMLFVTVTPSQYTATAFDATVGVRQ